MKLLALPYLLLFSFYLNAQTPDAVPSGIELAVGGFDVVSYFHGTPVRGIPQWSDIRGGSRYQFTNERNLHLFQADPQRYMPAFGGWCAYSLGKGGELTEADPAVYKIVDGRLLFFTSSGWGNTLKKWNRDEADLLRQADANWGQIREVPGQSGS